MPGTASSVFGSSILTVAVAVTSSLFIIGATVKLLNRRGENDYKKYTLPIGGLYAMFCLGIWFTARIASGSFDMADGGNIYGWAVILFSF